MISRSAYGFAFAAVLAFAPGALAQAVPRIKARIVSVAGDVMTLQPLAAPDPMTVTLLGETRIVTTTPSGFGDIKAGDYVGAAVVEKSGGRLRAQEVFVYADALRGTGEGRFTDKDRLLVNGTVTQVAPTAANDTNDGTLTLHYRGAILNPAGPNSARKSRTVCEGRAEPVAFSSALACSADAEVEVPPGTPVSALTLGDRSLLVPGRVASVAIAKLGDRTVTPGLTVEQPDIKAAPVEKPQSKP